AVLVNWLVGGLVGAATAVVAGVVVHRWVGRLESVDQRRRRQRFQRDLPFTLDLTVAALRAGRPPAAALAAAGSAVGGPLGDELERICARLSLGTDPLQVWRTVSHQPGLEPLGRAFGRAVRSGAPVTDVLDRCVEDLRAERRSQAQRAARAVGVRTAAPL